MENKDRDVQTRVFKMCPVHIVLDTLGCRIVTQVCMSLLIWG